MRRAIAALLFCAGAVSAHAADLKARVDALLAKASALEAVEVHPEARLAARRALVALAGRAAPYLLAHLPTVQTHELIEILAVLKAVGAPALPALAPLIASPDETTRRQAVLIFSNIHVPSQRAAILKLLDDPSRPIRAQATLACANQGDAWAVAPLVAVLLRPNEEREVLIGAARGMRYLALKVAGPMPGACERLTDLLDHPYYGVREGAMVALIEQGPRALPALCDAISRMERRGPSPALASAALALGTILGEHAAARNGAARARYDALLASPDANVRAPAVEALASWGPEGRTRALAILHGEPDPAVRQKIMRLAQVRPPGRPATL